MRRKTLHRTSPRHLHHSNFVITQNFTRMYYTQKNTEQNDFFSSQTKKVGYCDFYLYKKQAQNKTKNKQKKKQQKTKKKKKKKKVIKSKYRCPRSCWRRGGLDSARRRPRFAVGM
jgi:hypothetical protein